MHVLRRDPLDIAIKRVRARAAAKLSEQHRQMGVRFTHHGMFAD
jgi:hypothetical protein